MKAAGSMAAVACVHCGLPVAERALARKDSREVNDGPYCCFGCKIAYSLTGSSRDADGSSASLLLRLGVATFLSLNVAMFTMVLWTPDLYVLDDSSGAWHAQLHDVLRWLCLILTLPVLWLLGLPLLAHGWKEVRARTLGTDLFLCLGVLAATAYSVVSVLTGSGPIYFEVACVVLVAITLGRWLEASGKRQTTALLDELSALLPKTVRVLRDNGEEEIATNELQAGDLMCIEAGQRIPADGVVERGRASVDEQIVCGESEPRVKDVGDKASCGSLALDGSLWVRAACEPNEGTLARWRQAISAARMAKGRYQRLADRTAAWFLPVVIFLALGAAAWHGHERGLPAGFLTGMSVLLIACPCALGLATPLAVWAGLGAAAKRGVLFRDPEALERLAQVRAVCFDKTGTLTTGEPTIRDAIVDEHSLPPEFDRAILLEFVVAAAKQSPHPLAKAAARWIAADSHATSKVAPQCCVNLPGRGVRATFAELADDMLLGSQRLMVEEGCQADETVQSQLDCWRAEARTILCVGNAGRVLAAFAGEEMLRKSACTAIAACASQGLAVAVLTGDHEQRGRQLATALAVPVFAGLLPEDKVGALLHWRERHGATAMIGDGLNDLAALAAADVGVAMGCGADVTRDGADICLLGNDLSLVPWMHQLSQRTVRVIRQNLAWAWGYNLAGIGLALAGWLNPLWASAAMVVSSVMVIGNSLRLAHASNQHALDERDDLEQGQTPQSLDNAASTLPEPVAAGAGEVAWS